jgi:uncharacterized membrane protein YdjX (TVP38/TMEM64 family)
MGRAGDAKHSRRTVILRWILVGLAAAGCLAIVSALPVDRAVLALRQWLQNAGALGLVAFVAVYFVATLLFVPASALTVLAGGVFGLLLGTALVSVAATAAAAAAFLIARHLARGSVQRLADRYPTFGAVDRAIDEGGFKVIALLRLSPLFPFGAGNYLLGVTSARFVPFVLATWAFTLPGTFMYVYLGHVSLAELLGGAASGRSRTTGEWILLAVGVLATVAVTVYLTRLAKKQLATKANLEEEKTSAKPAARAKPRTAATVALGVVAAFSVAGGIVAQIQKGRLRSLLGPPTVRMKEVYETRTGGPVFDHSVLDDLVKRHVDVRGMVDYEALSRDRERMRLDAYIALLAAAPFAELGRDEKLALLIDAYNAFTLQLVLEHWSYLQSIQDIPEEKRWRDVRWRIGPKTLSLDQIEHEEIRPKFREPRIHFALVCAAKGCPPLRREAYVGARIEEQLEDQARVVHGDPRWFALGRQTRSVRLTMLYHQDWFARDFEQVAEGSVLDYAARYVRELHTMLVAGGVPSVQWVEYDWSLNARGR